MAYLWRGIKIRIQRLKCSTYADTCSLCAEWKAAKRKAALGCPEDCPACTQETARDPKHDVRR